MRHKPGWGVGDIDPRKITIRSVVCSLGSKKQEDTEGRGFVRKSSPFGFCNRPE